MGGKEPPTLTVVAGQNGAGKSTLVAAMTAEGYDFGPFVNPDVIAAKLPAGTANREYQAGKLAIEEAREHIGAPRSFAQETTLTGRFARRLMSQAKRAGFSINLLYVGVSDLSVSLARVANRVAEGGHDIPTSDQKRRFTRSRDNIAPAARVADNAVLLDNSDPDRPYHLAADIEQGVIRFLDPQAPRWSREAISGLSQALEPDRLVSPFAARIAEGTGAARRAVTRGPE